MEDETSLIRPIGRYRPVSELGRGAMGVVYKGYDPTIGRTVALKTIALGVLDDQAKEFRKRLYAEASAAGALAHPNIVTIYDVVEDGNTLAVAMEFIEGQTLASIIAEQGPLPLDRALDLFEQICAALDFAGSRGIVHRDIKPANILVGLDGRPRIADFGIARLPTSQLTQTGMVLGSPGYMSPEQVKGLPLDRRSDLFSAATLFYEMITKTHPFGTNDMASTMYRVVHEAATPPDQLIPSIGPAVTAVFERALAKDADDRFPTGAELIAALRAATNQAGQSRAYTSITAATPAHASVPEALPARASSGRLGLALAGVGLIAAVIVGALMWNGRPHEAGGSPTPANLSPPAPGLSATNVPPSETGAKTAANVASHARPGDAQAPKSAPARLPAGATAASSNARAQPADSSSQPPTPAAPAASPSARVSGAQLEVEYAGAPYPVIIYVGSQQVGRLESSGPVNVAAGDARIRAVAESAFLDRDFGTISLKAGERHKLSIPGLATATIGVKGDLYTGVRIFVDEKPVAGPYPAQLPRLAAGAHAVRFTWVSGEFAGKELKQAFDATASGHFVIRAVPENEQIAVQQTR